VGGIITCRELTIIPGPEGSDGKDRQKVHEEIRVLSHQAAAEVKQKGKDNDLIPRIAASEFFKIVHADLEILCDPMTFIGRAPQQVEKFVGGEVKGAIEKYQEKIKSAVKVELSV